jgi:hypothetical protein
VRDDQANHVAEGPGLSVILCGHLSDAWPERIVRHEERMEKSASPSMGDQLNDTQERWHFPLLLLEFQSNFVQINILVFQWLEGRKMPLFAV